MADDSRMDPPLKLSLFGYPLNEEADSPLAMEEVTIVADVNTLRTLSQFLGHAADLAERHGDEFGHEHFSRYANGQIGAKPDVIIMTKK